MFGQSPRVSTGTSLLSFNLLLGCVLKFHSVGTALMRIFDFNFFRATDLSFFRQMFECCCVAFVNRTRRISPRTYGLFRKIDQRFRRLCVLKTKTKSRASFKLGAALLSQSLQPACVCKRAPVMEFASRNKLLEETFGRILQKIHQVV